MHGKKISSLPFSHLIFYRLSLLIWISITIFLLAPSFKVYAADNTKPVTTDSLTGTLGNDGWYRSDIGVTLTVTDADSGPDKTTYWIDSGSPITVDYTTLTLPSFQNNSFEQGSFSNITNWYEGLGGLAIYYRSNTSPKDGNNSAAIAFIGSGTSFYHWHDEPNAVAFPVGANVEISAWARAVMSSGDLSFFEVWGQNPSGGDDTKLATSDVINGFNWNWQKIDAQFTVPSATNYIYLKLGSTASPAAIIYYDLVEVKNTSAGSAQTQFTHTTEGVHTLHYFSRDNAGNTENGKTSTLKKDTVVPNPWQNFVADNTGCSHCYTTWAEIKDITSGMDVSTAEYRFYTDHNMQYWSSWLSAASVKKAGTNNNAADGETGFVTIKTPEISFGDSSSGPFRVQYRVYDMAGNLGTSPVYEIASPWIKGATGSVYIGGEISVPGASSGENNSDADVMSAQDIVSYTTGAQWLDDDYTHELFGVTQIEEILPAYLTLKSKAAALPSGRLPQTNGLYIVHGGFNMSSSTIGSGYDTADVSAVVIIEGNLTVSNGFTVANNNNTVFLIEGDILVDKNVEDMAGFYIAEGIFNSDTSGDSKKPLEVNGSVVALNGYELPRDLGSSGPENNTNTPAEKFNWQADMLTDVDLARYLNDETYKYIWQEIER